MARRREIEIARVAGLRDRCRSRVTVRGEAARPSSQLDTVNRLRVIPAGTQREFRIPIARLGAQTTRFRVAHYTRVCWERSGCRVIGGEKTLPAAIVSVFADIAN